MCEVNLRKKIWFYSLCVVVFILSPSETTFTKQLTFHEQKHSRSLLFISTLDGKISALDANDFGKKQWTLDFNDGPMLSSNIHRREVHKCQLNNNGQWIRLIPSLSGGLYKFDGENLEAVPVSANQLLHSSFRYSDDLIFTGGREVKSYGISSTTGQVLYECGINGCTNTTEKEAYVEQEMLIVQRFQQTVRAIEPRSGIERWNFSVGQHDLVLVHDSDTYCQNKIPFNILDIEIKVIIPEGLIWAINRDNPTVKLWQQKFDSPIVAIWREDANIKYSECKNLKEINLFDNKQWSWGTEFSTSPDIYLGMHDRQLYIQENEKLYKSLEISQKYMQHSKYPWQPYPAIGDAIRKTLPNPTNDNNDVLLKINDVQSTTALSVLYNSEYVNGNGFYLYSKDQLQSDDNKQQCNHNDPNILFIDKEEKLYTLNDTYSEDDTPVQIIIVSLWYWWREVLVISITTAILLNFVLTQRLLNATTVAKDAILPPLIIERHIETNINNVQLNDDEKNDESFKSRYLTDFEPVDCLGKGGYGVVFEARNKIDDCNYAIKRIALPNSKYSRERVMREVKALAKLDHQNIVRYFNAWLECPPTGWQEKHDLQWMSKLIYPNSEFTTNTEIAHSNIKTNNSVCINVTQTDRSLVDSASEACEVHSYDSNEDSFIVFENSHSAGSNKNIININDYNHKSSNSSVSSDVVEEALPIIDDCTHSEGVVFEDVVTKHPKKEKERKRRTSFSLNLTNKSDVSESPKMYLYIQMQLCQRLSLREWLKVQSTRDYRRVLNIFQQIVEAVEYVHLQGLIHRDLKPSNIFFSFDDKIKVGDFGLVTAMTENYDEAHIPLENEDVTLKNSLHTAYVGTHLYMSPEQINGQGYNYKVDIYSLGIILFELLIPFVTEMERITTLMNLRKSVFPKNFGINYPSEYNLLNMMLDENPSKRPTTLGIKAKPPLLSNEITNGFDTNEDIKWHFELPQLTRHSSVISSSSSSDS